MNSLKSKLMQLAKEEEGATAVEYAVMLVLIIVVCIAAITLVGKKANNAFQNVADSINK